MKTIRYRSRTAETRRNKPDAQIKIVISITARTHTANQCINRLSPYPIPLLHGPSMIITDAAIVTDRRGSTRQF
ncbi:hypothetical protein DPMN_052812 [Dreissena polymorpha]|uniref:Uncharacterized protein n=1 Tax=Dreissena polymorpha TaxID=45954 RepID=A0A9D4CMH0_DREPO|nr:hypothetical protein DPMN_052812 [Dreissena polymorpha]